MKPTPEKHNRNRLDAKQVFVIHGRWPDSSSSKEKLPLKVKEYVPNFHGFAQNQMARQFVKQHPVIFVDLPVSCWRRPDKLLMRSRTRRLACGITYYLPLVFPRRLGRLSQSITDSLWAREIKKLSETKSRESGPYARVSSQPPIVFFDTPWQERWVGQLGEALSVYYAIDDKTVDILGRCDQQAVADEIALLNKVDVVFAISESLGQKLRAYNEHVFVVPNGYDGDIFDHTKSYPMPQELQNIKRPIIGFTGYISERVDVNGVLETARQRTNWSFVFIGAVGAEREISRYQLSHLQSAPNIHMLGPRPFREMPAYISAFDVCFIPYCLSRFTIASSPVKAYEYLALGKPVVSTKVPDLIKFGDIIYFADSHKDYHARIEQALDESSNSQLIEKRIQSVKDCTTFQRSEQVRAILSDILGRLEFSNVEKNIKTIHRME